MSKAKMKELEGRIALLELRVSTLESLQPIKKLLVQRETIREKPTRVIGHKDIIV